MRWAVLLCLAACGTEYSPTTVTPTWYADVGPIVRTRCAGCHNPAGIAPFSLMDIGDVHDEIGVMLDAIDTGVMPPFEATDANDCLTRHPWADDPRVTTRERELLHGWIDGGLEVGTPAALPSPPRTALESNLTVAPVQPFASSGDRDQFVCYLFDPQLDRDRWLTGVQVRPGIAALVHHATVTVIAPEDAATTLATFGAFGIPYANCDSTFGTQVHTWLPGNPPLVLPDGVAQQLRAHALISVQLHYHPAGVGGVDATAIDLRVGDTPPAWTYQFASDGNAIAAPTLLPGPDDPTTGPAFLVPANSAAHTETMITPTGDPGGEVHILSFTPHMHFLGTHLRATVTHGSGDVECLGNSGWSFDWQRTYTYGDPITQLPLLDTNSVVTVSCEYDNTFGNPQLPRLLHDANLVAPYDVTFGLTTTNEMCLANLGLVRPYTP